jgi:hypothetical protein
MNAGKGGFGAALDSVDARHRQAGRVDAIYTAGSEQIALHNI